MTGVFLQVRLDSTRLPKKALLPLGEKTVVEHAMRALSLVEADSYVVLTDEESAEELYPYVRDENFELFVGSKEDVLKRYADAAREYGCGRVVRATGDNPLVSAEAARRICALHEESSADYSGFRGLPLGTGIECVETQALFEAEHEAGSRHEREHVCPYIYEHPDRFIVNRPQAPSEYHFPEGRVTLDTKEDYKRLEELYEQLYRGGPVPIMEVIRYLSTRQVVAG